MTDFKSDNAAFKYTIPITKSQADDDGLFIFGEASGPEVDLHDERLDDSAIADFAAQIKDRYAQGEPVPYLDEHPKDGGRGVLRHLGDLVDGEVTEKGHLWVKVRLHEDNPAATFLYRQIQAGKKFGMSVSGNVNSWADEVVKSVGRKVRTFKSVTLDHIANTTKPVWTPSFGTVLNRAIEKALSEGETMAEEIVVESAKNEETPTNDQDTAVEETTNNAESTTEEPENSVLDSMNEKIDKMAAAVLALADSIKPTVTETPEPVTAKSEAEETTGETVEKSLADRMSELEAALVQKSEEIEELKKLPATPRPPVITKSEQEELTDLLKSMSPEERLRFAFAAQRGEEFTR